MAIMLEIVRDDLDPDEYCFLIKYDGKWIGRIRRREEGWEARSVEGLKGPILFSSPERAAQSLVFSVAL